MIFEQLYSIWQSRNEWVFKRKRLTVDQILQKASSLTPPQNELLKKPQQPAAHTVDNSSLAVFFDASIRPNIGTGMGMLVQDTDGGFMAAATHPSEESIDADVGEALTLKWTLTTLEELGITHVNIFTDSLNVVRAWQRKHHNSFVNIKMRHIPRSVNIVAHRLAAHALVEPDKVWLDICPVALEPVFGPATSHVTNIPIS
ncbi:MAG: ribonuclease H family protein [Sweet potato little leaf phytoplasma]|nr:ribonuclease H family protein [Sweet potato little leaf phytoplasma]